MIGAVRRHAFGESPPEASAKKPRQWHESEEQKKVVRWIRAKPNWMVIRVENAAKRSQQRAAVDKAMGMNPGAPDLLVYYRKFPLWLEMKALKGEVSREQEQCHTELRARGQIVFVCYGARDAISRLEAFAAMCDNPSNGAPLP